MSQFQASPSSPAPAAGPKTSGLAIAALVLALIGIIPCLGVVTGLVGIVLGLIGVATIDNVKQKGKGLAIAAIILGIVFVGAQAYIGKKLWDVGAEFMQIVMEGPKSALEKGFAGDLAGFKAEFHGMGAAQPDAVAQTFLDTLEERYGSFVTAGMDTQGGPQPQAQPGQPSAPFPYVITFQNKKVDAEAEIVFADQTTGAFVKKLGYLIVFDPTLGDVRYPPAQGSAPPAPTPPAGNGGVDGDADVDDGG